MIHAIWLGNRLSTMASVCIDDWKKQGYDYKLWTEEDPEIREWIFKCRFAKKCYEKKLYAFVTDYLRLKILFAQGGLYLDTDVTIQKNPFPLFDGIEFSVGYENESFLGTAVIFAQKGSLILSELIRFYESDIWGSDLYIGPKILTYLLINKGLKDIETSKFYDTDFFYSYTRYDENFITPENAYLIHWFQKNWGEQKNISFLKSKHLNLPGKIYVWQKYFFKRFFNRLF